MTTKRALTLLLGCAAGFAALVLSGCGGGETELVPTATTSPGAPATAMSVATAPLAAPTSAATVQPSPTAPAAQATPCPQHLLTPAVGALAANLADAINRWNQWLGCPAFALDQTASQPGVITVDFAPAEIQDPGWAQYSGGAVYLAPPTTPPANSAQPYANDYDTLTCVVLHGLGHILGYQDDAAGAPLIMRPLSWPSWPPSSCPTPDSS
jgi:hypothetical protein